MSTFVRPIDIVVPFYKNEVLAEQFFNSLGRCQNDLLAINARVIAINDSPEDAGLRRALDRGTKVLDAIGCVLIENEKNTGFVKSSNAGLAAAVRCEHDAVLLNSDAFPTPGALPEMRRVAYLDPMIGFVSPRSNNATICSLPHQREFARQPEQAAREAFLKLSPLLPDYHYVPTAVGFCLFIKFEVLAEFGYLDEVFGSGYDEENDLIMRANRCGYRVVLANRAFVYHRGQESFGSSAQIEEHKERNARVLQERYPEYAVGTTNYENGPHYRAEMMLSAFLPHDDGRLDVVFDFSHLGVYHCGTFEFGIQVLRSALELWRDRYCIYVTVSEESKRFHKLAGLPGALFLPPDTERTFAAALHMAQPFSYKTAAHMCRLALVNVYAMLDPIALDCLHLRQPHLDRLWETTLQQADGIIYISDFVRRQFHSRFQVSEDLEEIVAYLSLDPAEYRETTDSSASSRPGEHILVVGNKFEHKRMNPTLAALSTAFPRTRIVALGGAKGFPAANVHCCGGGDLSDAEVNQLYRDAKVVIYPSVYEGFGIPVVKALAFRKPVLARSIPVMCELRDLLPNSENIYLYPFTGALIEALRKGIPAWKETAGDPAAPPPLYRWSDAVNEIGWLVDRTIEKCSFRRIVSRINAQDGSLPNDAAGYCSLEKRVADIYDSWSWRLTAPMRAAGKWGLAAAGLLRNSSKPGKVWTGRDPRN